MKIVNYFSVISLTLLLITPLSSHAVIILDSTYKESGFTQAEQLALTPQFKSLIYLSGPGSGSGSWIGNYEGHGYVLTAGHMFDKNTHAKDYAYTTIDGKEYQADKVYFHPLWNGDLDTKTGFDFAIVRLTTEVDDAGSQPWLYGGTNELNHKLVFIGYGYRGTGTKGQDKSIDTHDTPAAGEGLIETVVDIKNPIPDDDDAGSYFGIWLPKEDGSLPNPFNKNGITKPISSTAGILGSGDSGGPAWIKTDSGWAIAGINSNGNGNAAYGEKSWFGRVSYVKDWILKKVPIAKFVDD